MISLKTEVSSPRLTAKNPGFETSDLRLADAEKDLKMIDQIL